VQEILAKAFDRYCADIGYEQALPVIKEWLSDSSPNVRRAVTEGLRIWTGRPYFRDHPEIAVQLLSRLRDDESEYVRKSVGNAIRDISKKHKELVRNELQRWGHC
jgi:3-methyladenine DNA glycosylase AlkC